jgi:hypothetical protein
LIGDAALDAATVLLAVRVFSWRPSSRSRQDRAFI